VKMMKHNRIQLVWVFGCMRIDTMEMADQLDRQGSSHPLTGPEPTLGLSARVSRGLSRDWTSREDGDYWQSIRGQRLVKGIFKRLCTKTVGEIHSLSRNQLHTMMELTGHCHLKGHQFKLVLVNNLECDRCKQTSETSARVLCDCEALAMLRFRHLGQLFMKPGDLRDMCQEDTAKHMNTRAAQRISYYGSVQVTALLALFVFFSVLPKC
jgi:hypothetical protein